MNKNAETLHAAAALLLERAGVATPGPWVQNGINGIHTRTGTCIATTARHDDEKRHADAVYIGTVHPPVALALAHWLEMIARANEQEHHVAFEADALVVAKAILREGTR